ncbi:MAG: hypothetical protein JXQ73_29105 [Phycisphaerae bacterium]|nr:hypothetical protein [Phycisphaerae bacterium]
MTTRPDDIQRRYLDAVYRMTPAERYQRCCSLYASMHRALSLQIAEAHPGMSAEEVRWHVASRMYLTDAGAQKLLRQAWDRSRHDRV